MNRKRLTRRGAEKLGERERGVGVDAGDDVGRWLADHDPAPAPAEPKRPRKSKALHQWRRRQER
jgi:hypothetical protein